MNTFPFYEPGVAAQWPVGSSARSGSSWWTGGALEGDAFKVVDANGDSHGPDGRYDGGAGGGKGWAKNFPRIEPMTTGAKLQQHPDYKAAKAGDTAAASQIVFDVANRAKVAELGKLYPTAKVVPVRAQEAAGRNKLPVQLSMFISEHNGMDVDLGIVQTNRVYHTGADAASRFAFRARFNGEVEKGREYIIADDFVTAGGTVSELRQYIEGKGGKVVAVTALAVSSSAQIGYSGDLAIKPETLHELKRKFGYNQMYEFLKENDIYGGNVAALTNGEARWLLSFGSIDAIRNRIAASRDERKRRAGQEILPREAGAGESGATKALDSFVPDTLIHYGSAVKSIEETATGWRFGGYLVVFDSHDVSRLRDKFTKSTDFDIQNGERRSLYYNHGLDSTLKRTRLGDCRVQIKEAGVWIEGEIKKRKDYLAGHAQNIAENIEQFGLSSGAPAHLVERKRVDGGHEVTLWPLAEASITPTPAEPLTGCFSLKSLAAVEASQGFSSQGSFTQTNHLQNLKDSLPDGLTFQDHSQHVLAANGEFLQRIASLADCRCVKSNRRWSAEKYGLLLDTATDLTRVAEALKALAHAHAPRPEPNPHATEILAQIELTRARLNGVDL